MGLFSKGFGAMPGVIDGAEARRLVEEEGALLVDVRTDREFAARHADGAMNIPLPQLVKRCSEFPRTKKVIVYCQSGGRSASAAQFLRRKGYEVLDAGGIFNVMR